MKKIHLAVLLLCSILIYSCEKGNDIEDATLISSKSVINFTPQGGLDSLVVTSSVRWKFSDRSSTAWLQVSKDSGNAGTTTIYVEANVNPLNTARNTTLEIISLETAVPPVSILIDQSNELKIDGFTNYRSRGGATLNIYGRGFSPSPQENLVTINGVTASVQTASNTNLRVIVPYRAGSGPIIVSSANKSDTSDVDMIYVWVGEVTIIAGGTQGSSDGTGTGAQFYGPEGIGFDSNDNLYVTDYNNWKVRKISPDAVVTTLPGRTPSNNFPPGQVPFYDLPTGVSAIPGGGVAIVEYNGNAITKFTEPSTVTLFAGGNQSGFQNGIGTAASFYRPVDLAVDAAGNIFVADKDNLCIRKITPNRVVTTFAGGQWGYEDGVGTAAKFNRPMGIDIDAANNLYVTDYFNSRIRKITPTGIVTTIAGTEFSGSEDGPALTHARFDNPYAICIAPNGTIFVSELDGDNKIRLIQPNGKVETIVEFTNAATGQPFEFRRIAGLDINSQGVLYASDFMNNRIVKVNYK